MKVLLKQDVPKIGKKGELLDVKEGYARNFLIPNGLAVEASGGAMKQVEEEKRAQDRRKAKEKEEAQALGKRIEAVPILLKHKAGDEGRLFGSITSSEIADAFEQKGFGVDKKKIVLDEPIRLVGRHTVKIKLHPEVVISVVVEVAKL
jgi:large subunit ribosomal protein L9